MNFLAFPSPYMLNVLLATYNEAETIATTLSMVKGVLHELKVPFKVIVVDGNSPDGTSGIVKSLDDPNIQVVVEKCKAGLGASYMEGLRHCIHDYTVIMDADLQHDPFEIANMFKKAQQGYDVVTGTRYGKDGKVCNTSFVRKLTSAGANNIAKYVLGLRTSDLTGSFRCYNTKLLRRLLHESTCRGFGIQVELIARAERSKSRIYEIPITFHDRFEGDSKFKLKEMYLFVVMVLLLYIKL